MSFRLAARTLPLALGLAALLSLPAPAGAQIPDKFTNLKVLPKNISKQDLIAVMRGFSMSLGVRCDHCHVDQDNPKKVDFASDDKKPKEIARGMMRMVDEVNGKLIPKAGVEHPTQVMCVTCHRGVTDPQTLSAMIDSTIVKDGVPAGIQKYKETRDRYYGSGAYDFRPGQLSAVADWLAHSRSDVDGAISVIQLSLQFDPNSAPTYATLGHLQEAKGDKNAAIASYKKSLEIDPDDPRVQQALKQVQGAH
jgi:tetratricopeptide (TPR) repeat protein